MKSLNKKLPGRWTTSFDENGKTTKVVYEASFRRLLGYDDTAEYDVSDDSWFESIHPDDLEIVENAYAQAVKKHTEEFDYDVEYRMKTASGDYRWFHDYARCIRRPDGSLQRFDGVVFDIQDSMDRQEKLLMANNQHERLRADSLAFIMKNDDLEAFVDFFSGRVLELYGCDQVIYRDCEGRMILKDKPGAPSLDFSLCKDCPHYAFDAEVYQDGFTAMDDCADGWNGIPVHKDCPVRASLTYLVYEHDKVFGYIALHYLGKTHPFTENEKKTFDNLAKFLSMVLSRRKQQLKLKRSMALTDGLSREYHTVWTIDAKTHALSLYRTTGVSTAAGTVEYATKKPNYDSGIDWYIDNFVDEEDRARVRKAVSWESIVRNTPDIGVYSVTYKRHPKPDVTDYHQMCFAKAMSEDGETNYVFAYRDVDAIVRDQMAEQKERQEALMLKSFGNLINAAPWSIEFNDNLEVIAVHWSDETRHMFGFENEKDFPNKMDAWSDRIHPEDKDWVMKYFWEGVQNGDSKGLVYDITYRIRRKDGEYRWYRQVGRNECSPEGILKVFGLSIDVSAEKALEERDERFEVVKDLINAGLWDYKLSTDDKLLSVEYSFDLEKVFNLPDEYRSAGPEALFACLHPEDREATEAAFNAAVADHSGKTPYDVTYRLLDRNGGYNWFHVAGKIIRHADDTGDFYGIIVNINEQMEEQKQRAFDEAEAKRLKAREQELMHAEFRAAAVAYLTEHEGDVKSFLDFFADRLRKLIKCDQVIYQGPDGNDTINSAPEFKDFKLDPKVCSKCPHQDYRSPVYANGMTELEDHRKGFEGTPVAEGCPVKSSLTRIIYLDGNPNGYLAIHYINEYHSFTEHERQTLEEFANLLSISLSRFEAREKNAELQRELKLKQKIEEQQQQLQEALAMAQSASRAKTTFLNNMSHDIRTPMNAIIGFTGLAASHIDNKEQVQDYLTKIGQSSDHLLSLINDVLDMSRIESGKMNLDEKPENLPAIIHTLRDIVQADIRAKQHDFFIDTVNVNDEDIVCDKLRLNQVLLNILSNAIKYTANGGIISLRITEKAVKPSGYATYEFCIKDNGMGMDADYLKTIFDPFTRVKSSTVSGIQGTGLGMAITKNIIDMMGGQIEIQSTPGKGTQMNVTFDFRLQSAPKEAMSIPELKGLRGLVVDDDADTCMSITGMMRDIGMRDEWCVTGKEAVLRAAEAYRIGDSFKVYIIDWLMPDMNGIETTRRIRKVIGDEIPIIILTAYDWSDIEDEAREAGATAFVSKPMFPSDLHRVLNNCLGKTEEPSPVQTDNFDFTGKKVLIVEDNELNREIAIELLTEYGCITDTAEDGTIAVEKMKKAKLGDYDIVLMDIQMPLMNGYEAAKAIRAMRTPISQIPILAMTADAFAEDRKHALDVGMNDHITKPINTKLLRQTLAKYL